MLKAGEKIYYITYKDIRGFGRIPDGFKQDAVTSYDEEDHYVHLLDADNWIRAEEVCYTKEEIQERFKKTMEDLDLEELRRVLQVYAETNNVKSW